jgi:desulfoferrodoxin (superoxide reductase-like protein)
MNELENFLWNILIMHPEMTNDYIKWAALYIEKDVLLDSKQSPCNLQK